MSFERGKRMNGIERYDAAVRQEPPDKIPIRIGNYNMFICNYYEITIRQYVDDPALNAEVFVRFVREFGFDSVKAGLGYILYGCGPELGPEWMFIEGDFPACVKVSLTMVFSSSGVNGFGRNGRPLFSRKFLVLLPITSPVAIITLSTSWGYWLSRI